MCRAVAIGIALALAACATDGGPDPGNPSCGPSAATVTRVIDGDTIVLTTGERVRYLLIDAPETTLGHDDCYGSNATQLNRDLVDGQAITLTYDVECTDTYGRLLAYVWLGDTEVNAVLVERGDACVLHVPPNGSDQLAAFEDLEALARAHGRGVWSCDPLPPACR